MRNLGIPVTLSDAAGTQDSVIIIRTAASYSADELVRDNIIRELPEAFLRLLEAAGKSGAEFRITAISKDQIGIQMSAGLLTEPWQVAALLNLIDSSTFVGRIDDDPFIVGIDVRSSLVRNGSLNSIYLDLERVNISSDNVMIDLLPREFDLFGLGRVWPDTAPDFFFDIALKPTLKLDEAAQRAARAILDDFDTCLAGSAFEPTVQPEAWFENGIVPYPVEIDVHSDAVKYKVEFPPSSISTGLRLVGIALNNKGIRINDWVISIREGW